MLDDRPVSEGRQPPLFSLDLDHSFAMFVVATSGSAFVFAVASPNPLLGFAALSIFVTATGICYSKHRWGYLAWRNWFQSRDLGEACLAAIGALISVSGFIKGLGIRDFLTVFLSIVALCVALTMFALVWKRRRPWFDVPSDTSNLKVAWSRLDLVLLDVFMLVGLLEFAEFVLGIY